MLTLGQGKKRVGRTRPYKAGGHGYTTQDETLGRKDLSEMIKTHLVLYIFPNCHKSEFQRESKEQAGYCAYSLTSVWESLHIKFRLKRNIHTVSHAYVSAGGHEVERSNYGAFDIIVNVLP